MHVVVRKYTTAPNLVDETRPTFGRLEETMRSLPGFVAYYFVETDDGVVTITITEDETGTEESMGMAANWIEQHTPHLHPGAPEVTMGHSLINATR